MSCLCFVVGFRGDMSYPDMYVWDVMDVMLDVDMSLSVK